MSCDHDLAYTEESYDSFKERYQAIGLTHPTPARKLDANKVEFVRKTQHFHAMMDSGCLCHFVWGPSWQLYDAEQMVKMMRAISGWDLTLEEVLMVGERRLNMMRVFNSREGIEAAGDNLPDKFFDKPLRGGVTDGVHVDRQEFEAALEEYYGQCGWDKERGVPTNETLKRIDLEWLIT